MPPGSISTNQAEKIMFIFVKKSKPIHHKSAEAMGAIGDPVSLPILREYLKDGEVSVRETCELAIEKIEGTERANQAGIYGTIDPAPSMMKSFHETEGKDLGSSDLIKMKLQLLDQQKTLFERYRAMFGLRDAIRRTPDTDELDGIAVEALAAGFSDPSALFR
jgi:deoxyhypusine monooxygenase